MPASAAVAYDPDFLAESPEPWPRYDLVVVGGGTAGIVAARGAARLGLRAALVHVEGADSALGCGPAAALARCARAAADARRLAELGVRTGPVEVDFAAVITCLRQRRRQIVAEHDAAGVAEAGGHVFRGPAMFTGRDRLEVDGVTLRFRRAVLATGSRARALDVPGASGAGVLTSDDVLGLGRLPARLVVVGGGPVGSALAQAFRRLGSEVVLVTRGRLLPGEDVEAGQLLRVALARDGVDVREGAEATHIAVRGRTQAVQAGAVEVEGDRVLAAVGRRPNLSGLGLSDAGVEVNDGNLVLDAGCRTTNGRIFAVGDVALGGQSTHAADAFARLAVQNALFRAGRSTGELVAPRVTHTDPEVAHVGPPAEALDDDRSLRTVRLALDRLAGAPLDGDGFVKIRVDRRGRIHGATLVGRDVGELVGEIALAIAGKVPLGKLADVVHPYAARSDVLRRAAQDWLLDR